MYICNYCGRYLKKEYEKCPGCGSKSFKQVQNYEEMIIKTPPQNGYKINYSNYKHGKKSHWDWLISGLIVLVILIPTVFIILNNFFDKSIFTTKIDYVFLFVFTGAIIIFGFIEVKKYFDESKRIRSPYDKNIARIKKLSKTGMLIKNLKYEVKLVSEIAGKSVYVIQVRYEFEKGNPILFESEPKYLTALGRDDGTVDLLVDPDDYSNYFIDFEIY